MKTGRLATEKSKDLADESKTSGLCSDSLVQRLLTAAPKPSAHPVTKIKILVTDDALTNQKILMRVIGSLAKDCDIDPVIITADNGLEAVNAVKTAAEAKDQFKLIIMDLEMPQMDGKEASLKIREIDSSIPIVCCSANVKNEVGFMPLAFCMNSFMQKPVSKEGVKMVIDQYKLPLSPSPISADEIRAERSRRLENTELPKLPVNSEILLHQRPTPIQVSSRDPGSPLTLSTMGLAPSPDGNPSYVLTSPLSCRVSTCCY